MNEAKVRALKLQIQAAAVEAARKFYEVDREETGHGRCGGCESCQSSMDNLARLFFKAMERELSVLFHEELEKEPPRSVKGRQTAEPFEGFIPKDRLN